MNHDIWVRKAALPEQRELLSHPEHCSMDPGAMAAIGCEPGQQVRIVRSAVEYGVFTANLQREENQQNVVRLGLPGRRRLGLEGEFRGSIDIQVTNQDLSEAAAQELGEFIERLDHQAGHRRLIAIAPHGGGIERYTDQQAGQVCSRLSASSWRCLGWKSGGGAYDRWHITSTDIHEASFPLLRSVIHREFRTAVAFHGFDDDHVLIGGSAPAATKQSVGAAVARAIAGSGVAVRVAHSPEGCGGDDPRNIVNRLSEGGTNGIQIEQPLRTRRRYWRAVADAVADVLAS